MKAESHIKRAENIKKSIDLLISEEGDVGSIVELVYGCSMHYLSYGCEKRFGTHKDIHTGLQKFLRERNEEDMAIAFGELDTIRMGRWYGGKGNGETISKVLEVLNDITRWAYER
ncbi:MAG: hypothetical protein HZC47_10250 [Methanobacterium sp.]|uniref:hypothetical protein n=1 Tax=Methanobacterium sp. TaxID=2164 RepID=UPI003D66286E|nr:hypothetical protein [Methanobacterium sp.]